MRVLWLLFALGVASAPHIASAQAVDDATRAAARNLATEGVQEYQANDFAAASEKLERAYRALHAPSLGLWSARALVKLGRLVEAGERYLEVTRLPISGGDESVQKQAKADAQSELDALTPRIPSVVVQIEGADAATVNVTIDGASINSALLGVARPIDPGSHELVGTSGSEQARTSIEVKEGERKPALLRFSGQQAAVNTAPATAAPAPIAAEPGARSEASSERTTSSPANDGPHPLRTVGLVTGGAGLVAIAVGSVFGLAAKSSNDKSNADRHCDASGCDGAGTTDRNAALRQARVSTGLFIAGGALLAGGVTLYLVGGSHSESASLALTPLASANGAGLCIHGGF